MRRTQLIVAALLLFPCGLLAAADRGGDTGRVQPEAAARMPPDRWAEERALFMRLRPQAEMGRWSNVEPHLAELGDYPLVPDLRAAWLHRRLGAGTDSELARFLRRYDNLGFTRGLRLRWARSLAARKEWERYLSVYDSYLVERDDTELDFYALQGRLATGPDDALVEDALVFWLSAYSQPKACDPLFDYLAEVNAITPAIRHERITLALEAGQISLARYLARPLPDAERQRIEAWARMQRDPERSLRDPSAFDDSKDDRRLVTYGLKRLARRDPRKADAVLVLELQQTGSLPVLEPLGPLLVGKVLTRLGLDGLDQVEASHAGDSRSRGVQYGDEDQRPARGRPRVAHPGYGEEADDHVGQARGTDHQRQCVGEHVDTAAAYVGRVLLEPELGHHLVQAIQQVDIGADHSAAQAQLRQGIAGQLEADEDCRDGIGQDKHAVLGLSLIHI